MLMNQRSLIRIRSGVGALVRLGEESTLASSFAMGKTYQEKDASDACVERARCPACPSEEDAGKRGKAEHEEACGPYVVPLPYVSSSDEAPFAFRPGVTPTPLLFVPY